MDQNFDDYPIPVQRYATQCTYVPYLRKNIHLIPELSSLPSSNQKQLVDYFATLLEVIYSKGQ